LFSIYNVLGSFAVILPEMLLNMGVLSPFLGRLATAIKIVENCYQNC